MRRAARTAEHSDQLPGDAGDRRAQNQSILFRPRSSSGCSRIQERTTRMLMIRRVIDEGSYSTIFEASIPASLEMSNVAGKVEEDQRYAVKALKRDLVTSPRRRAASRSLILEASVLSKMDHENIIRLHGIGLSGLSSREAPFLVLDLLVKTLDQQIEEWKRESARTDRSDLGRLIGSMLFVNQSSTGTSRCSVSEPSDQESLSSTGNKRPRLQSVSSFSSMSETTLETLGHTNTTGNRFLERMQSAIGIARGVEYLHRRGVCHRDIKPHNCGFDRSGQIKLFDLNLALRLNPNDFSQGRLGEAVGTQRYMAPEVSRLECSTTASDVYGFAILLWEICTLKRPYNYNTVVKIRRKAMNGERPSVKSIEQRWLRTLLSSAWAPDHLDRPLMHAVLQSLEAGIALEPQVPSMAIQQNRQW